MPTTDIFDELKDCSIRLSGVRCLQRNPNGFVSVMFSTADYRALFLRKSAFIPRSRSSFCRANNSMYTFVAVFDAPYELLDGAIAHRLSK